MSCCVYLTSSDLYRLSSLSCTIPYNLFHRPLTFSFFTKYPSYIGWDKVP